MSTTTQETTEADPKNNITSPLSSRSGSLSSSPSFSRSESSSLSSPPSLSPTNNLSQSKEIKTLPKNKVISSTIPQNDNQQEQKNILSLNTNKNLNKNKFISLIMSSDDNKQQPQNSFDIIGTNTNSLINDNSNDALKPVNTKIKQRVCAENIETQQQQHHSKKARLVFTEFQRRTLQEIFKETKRPSKEMQTNIAQKLNLELTTVSNFFMNARRRSMDKWKDSLDDTKSSGNNKKSKSIVIKNVNDNNNNKNNNNNFNEPLNTTDESVSNSSSIFRF
jgi:hypothetical protein